MNSMVTKSVQIPAAGSYRIDREPSTVSFTPRHLFGLGGVRGNFRLRGGHVYVADPVGDSSVRVTISANSFGTGSPHRDTNVRSAQFLDSERHPDIGFVSTVLELVDGSWVLRGSLTAAATFGPLTCEFAR